MEASAPIPTSTYRLQLRAEFGFREAAAVVPYLSSLGVSHIYCSPILKAVPGSAHGYDVIDHRELSPELGGDHAWAALVAACRTAGLGLVVDVVPNHMAIPVPEELNHAIWDVLRLGRDSTYADWLDVDWDAQASETGHGRLLLPVLGQPLPACVAAGEVVVDADSGTIRYFDHVLPIAPGTEKLADDVVSLLDAQHYRLAFWRVAAEELNYRRFFDVTSLVGVRVEQPSVFDATHERLLQLVRAGEVDGLRIDHPDGLADPSGYLDRLAELAPGRWVVVEKILEHGERLPAAWRCAGTTGYDALAAVTRVLVDPAGEQPLTDLYTSLTGMPAEFRVVVDQSKRQVVDALFGAEVNRLVRDLDRVRTSDPAAADFTRRALRQSIVELLVTFDVYRAYAGDEASSARIDAAAARATDAAPGLADELRWVAGLLHRGDPRPEAEGFAVRFEQTTGPVMAKGVEDTAFYRYHRLVALNEVGGDPAVFATGPDDWHEHCARLARDWPAAMTSLSTHDTKRSEDVRARLLAIAEQPQEWGRAVTAWRAAAARHGPPDANTDYLFWQTLLGAWPLSIERMQTYLQKATREAKQYTSWTDPDDAYEERLRGYAARVFADRELMATVGCWLDSHLRQAGEVNALSQKLLQLTMPGVPDVYQGQELAEPSLVDPDNRRPVDFARRAALVALDSGEHPATDADVVPAKLRATRAVLRLRKDLPASFAAGYEPVGVTGPAAEHAVAYRRGADVIAVATRLPVGLRRRGGWADTAIELPVGDWHDVVTDRPATAALGVLLDALPVALIARTPGRGPA